MRIKIFDRVYGIDLSEIERENISPFSPFCDKDYEEVKAFKSDKTLNGEEEYYAKL